MGCTTTLFTMKTNEIYETITNKVIEGMKTAGSWKQLWSNPSPVSLAGHYYQGVNQLLLACSDYKSPVWASFNQIRSNGGTVNKGEKGTFIASAISSPISGSLFAEMVPT